MTSTQVKRLYRSRTDRILGGVCGGLGEYLNIDPTLMRLLWVVFTLVWGAGILAYIIAWIIVPLNPAEAPSSQPPPASEQPTPPPTPPPTKLSGIIIVGAIFIALGAVLLLQTLDILPWRWFWQVAIRHFWPLLFVSIGVALIAIGLKRY